MAAAGVMSLDTAFNSTTAVKSTLPAAERVPSGVLDGRGGSKLWTLLGARLTSMVSNHKLGVADESALALNVEEMDLKSGRSADRGAVAFLRCCFVPPPTVDVSKSPSPSVADSANTVEMRRSSSSCSGSIKKKGRTGTSPRGHHQRNSSLGSSGTGITTMAEHKMEPSEAVKIDANSIDGAKKVGKRNREARSLRSSPSMLSAFSAMEENYDLDDAYCQEVFSTIAATHSAQNQNRILRPMPSAPVRVGSLSRLSRQSDTFSETSLTTSSNSMLRASSLRAHRSSRSMSNSKSSSTLSLTSFDSFESPLWDHSSPASSQRIAKKFANCFLQAIANGNEKWAAEATVGDLLHDASKMTTIDDQSFVGKAAIIRRLNTGMEQLLKMLEKHVGDKMKDLQSFRPNLEVSTPDKKRPHYVVVDYIFKQGIRTFHFKDEFLLRDGKIRRLRRTRK